VAIVPLWLRRPGPGQAAQSFARTATEVELLEDPVTWIKQPGVEALTGLMVPSAKGQKNQITTLTLKLSRLLRRDSGVDRVWLKLVASVPRAISILTGKVEGMVVVRQNRITAQADVGAARHSSGVQSPIPERPEFFPARQGGRVFDLGEMPGPGPVAHRPGAGAPAGGMGLERAETPGIGAFARFHHFLPLGSRKTLHAAARRWAATSDGLLAAC